MKKQIIDAGMATAIVIKYDADWNEYKVPVSADTYYHTDDRDDAISTARGIYGDRVKIAVRGGANA